MPRCSPLCMGPMTGLQPVATVPRRISVGVPRAPFMKLSALGRPSSTLGREADAYNTAIYVMFFH